MIARGLRTVLLGILGLGAAAAAAALLIGAAAGLPGMRAVSGGLAARRLVRLRRRGGERDAHAVEARP